jgi:hypothetical protein
MNMTFLNSPTAATSSFGQQVGIKIDRDPDVAVTHARLATLARALDSAVRIPGTSVTVGADAALNLIPGVGTLAAKGIASYIILEARRMGMPKTTLLRMAGNVGVDFVISAIPLVGWFGDVFFRANQKNIRLVQEHLDRKSGIIDGPATAGRAPGSI